MDSRIFSAPELARLEGFEFVALIERWTPYEKAIGLLEFAPELAVTPPPATKVRRDNELPLLEPSLSN